MSWACSELPRPGEAAEALAKVQAKSAEEKKAAEQKIAIREKIMKADLEQKLKAEMDRNRSETKQHEMQIKYLEDMKQQIDMVSNIREGKVVGYNLGYDVDDYIDRPASRPHQRWHGPRCIDGSTNPS